MTGVLLINLGTPTAPTTGAVRQYLREFLSDPWVLDISPVGRFLLLYAVILPFRPKKSAEAYAQVWRSDGSPLMVHSLALTEALQARVGQDAKVVLGMRYGEPSIPQAIDQLVAQGVDRIVVVPLYPQYALSSTGTALAKVYEAAAQRDVVPPLDVVSDFYDDPRYIGAATELIEQARDEFQPDHVLFSYHGLPERQVRKSDHSGSHCFSNDQCCDVIGPANRSCYRAQCMATTRAIVSQMDLAKDTWSVGFQSRLGRTPWIQPYTDEIIPKLVEQGVRRLLVTCPSFVADCLETLEEIGIRAREDFLALGGEDLRLVPCVNSEPTWVSAVESMVREHLPPVR